MDVVPALAGRFTLVATLVFHEVMERFAGSLPRVLMVYNAGGMLLES